MLIENLKFYGTKVLSFDDLRQEAVLIICLEGYKSVICICFGDVSGSIGVRVDTYLLPDVFVSNNTSEEVELIDASSNDLLLRALGNDSAAKIQVATIFGENISPVAAEVIASRLDSDQLPHIQQ